MAALKSSDEDRRSLIPGVVCVKQTLFSQTQAICSRPFVYRIELRCARNSISLLSVRAYQVTNRRFRRITARMARSFQDTCAGFLVPRPNLDFVSLPRLSYAKYFNPF